MIEAAAVVRDRGPGGFAGLDRESSDAVGALLETLAEDWRELPTSPRVWEHAVRAAQRLVTTQIREPEPQFPGPLPAGYESPRRDKTNYPLSPLRHRSHRRGTTIRRPDARAVRRED